MPDEIEAEVLDTGTPAEQVESPEVVSTEPGTGQTAETVETPPEVTPEKRNADAIQRRIDQLTREKYEERRRSDALQAEIAQLRQGQPANEAPAPDLEAAVEARIKQRETQKRIDSVYTAGKSEFPDFDKSLETLALFGGVPPAMSEVILDLDDSHKVFNHLGSNPAEFERISKLSPGRMALEIARLETTLKQPKPQSISKAPPPINPIGGKSAPAEPEEFSSTAEYIAYRKKQLSR
jgi:hypothetical protein